MKIAEIKKSSTLQNRSEEINSAIKTLDSSEFNYSLKYLLSFFQSEDHIEIPEKEILEKKIKNPEFYKNIELKPVQNGEIILDKNIAELTVILLAGLDSGKYDAEWINSLFYFDVRGFVFIPRTVYFSPAVLENLQYKPFLQFDKKQLQFDSFQGIGYSDFKKANQEIDTKLIYLIKEILSKKGYPAVIGIAGQTAAGKTEIAEYLQKEMSKEGKSVKSIEMDNFFLDRDFREEEGIGSMNKESIHYSLLEDCIKNLKTDSSCEIPVYDQLTGESSHSTDSILKEGKKTITVYPADIIYIEGNFPFLFPEIAQLIDLKIMYLTDDAVRLKRKWKRDIDYRKKYNPRYLCNRYFRTQFLKAEAVYIEQLERCDIAVDTTDSSIWINKKTEELLGS